MQIGGRRFAILVLFGLLAATARGDGPASQPATAPETPGPILLFKGEGSLIHKLPVSANYPNWGAGGIQVLCTSVVTGKMTILRGPMEAKGDWQHPTSLDTVDAVCDGRFVYLVESVSSYEDRMIMRQVMEPGRIDVPILTAVSYRLAVFPVSGEGTPDMADIPTDAKRANLLTPIIPATPGALKLKLTSGGVDVGGVHFTFDGKLLKMNRPAERH